MSAAPKLIESYERLLEQSRRMLECAEQGDWPGLVQEKSRSLISVETLSRCSEPLDEQAQLRRMELLESILALDAEIRRRLEARRDELGGLINAAQKHRVRDAAYRAHGSATIFNAAGRFDKGRP